MHGNRRAVVLQRVINSNTVEDITTWRVDIKVDVGDVPKCPEIPANWFIFSLKEAISWSMMVNTF